MYRGYLPDSGPWAECSISYHNNMMTTPWGKVKPSDLQFVHRYKWSAKEHESMYKKLKFETKVQDKYLFDLQEQLLDIVGELAGKSVS